MKQKVTIVLVPEAGGGFSVIFPRYEELATFGETKEEALRNASDAFEGYMETKAAEGMDLELPYAFIDGAEVADVEAELSAAVEALARQESERWNVPLPAHSGARSK